MAAEESVIIGALAATGAIGGLGGAVLITRLLGESGTLHTFGPEAMSRRRLRLVRHFAMLVGVYVLECVAFSAGMCTQVFSVGLAVVWGIVFGLWFRRRGGLQRARRASFYISLYTCLPTVIFCVVLMAAFAVKGGLLSADAGVRFGIPTFVPWPANTILGFCGALAIGTVVLKTGITMGEVGWLVYRRAGETPQ